VTLPAEPKREVLEEHLARFKRQREEADSKYDDALTALDRAKWTPPDYPHPPPAPDETQVTPLNTGWEILRTRPSPPSGWRGRLARFVWALVEPMLVAQQTFNSLLVDHMNRNIQPQRELARSIASAIATLQQQVERLYTFQSLHMHYLQGVTPFVNAKDYEFDALAHRRFEDLRADLYDLNVSLHGLTAGVQGLSDEFLKHVESLTSKVQRYDARIDAVTTSAAAVQQQAAALKRALDRLGANATTAAPPATSGLAASSTLAGDSAVESWKYPAFEAAFRGSEDEVAIRLASYVPHFAGATDVLDIGCGRGEFLELLQKAGIAARGLDLNFEMVEICRARGLDVTHGDALSHLKTLADESLGGLFAAQVVEHLPPDYLLAFLSEAQRTLRPGATIVLETINVASWYAFFQSYIRDITHARPLHPETLQYLVTASGFASAEVQLRVPLPEASRLRRPPPAVFNARGTDKDAHVALASAVDNNVERLNALLFSYLDYAVIAKRA
jgi:SAM-dependent methyltransferase/phage shock protein A